MIDIEQSEGTAIVRIARGKVNALNGEAVARLRETFESLAAKDDVRSVILTGTGNFFSFGWDVPELYGYSRQDFAVFVGEFTSLYSYLFRYPKPLVAALNGHTVAGGCMLAIACDARLMITGRARIALNEITFGAGVFAGSTEILRSVVGTRNASEFLLTGAMYSAEEARSIGLVDEVTTDADLLDRAKAAAARYGQDAVAFRQLKKLVRGELWERIARLEPESIKEFIEIWCSESTRRKLLGVTIR